MDSLVGQHFGKWIVLEELGRDKRKDQYYKCMCACGAYGRVRHSNLKHGRSRQCRKCSQRSFDATFSDKSPFKTLLKTTPTLGEI